MYLRKLQNYQTVESESLDTVIFNDVPIRVGIREHFNRQEIQAYSKSKFQYNFSHNPLDYYAEYLELTKVQKTYAFALAFYRRISLPLEITLSTSISYTAFPIEQLMNFQHFEELFEKYYESFQKLDTENLNKKNDFKKKVIQTIFKLWLSGYGIGPNYTDNYISEELLLFLRNWNKDRSPNSKARLCKVSRFLGYVLSNEDFSPVQEIPKMFGKTSLKECELRKWNKLSNILTTEISQELYKSTFAGRNQ